MLKQASLLFIFMSMLHGCAQDYGYKCIKNQSDIEVDATIYQLEKDKTKYTLNEEGELCIPQDVASIDQVMALKNRVGEYYLGVAEMLTTEEEIKKVEKWLSVSNRPHELTETERGKFIVLYSTSPEDAQSNRVLLDNVLEH